MIKTKKNLQVDAFELTTSLDRLTPGRIQTLYRRAPLHRPVVELDKLWTMFENSSVVFSVWHNDRLLGLARVLTDGVLFSYLCDLAVEPDVQGYGVGRRLLDAVFAYCKGTEMVLRDTDFSEKFYEKNGFTKVKNAWRMQL